MAFSHIFFDLFGTLADLEGEDTSALAPFALLTRWCRIRHGLDHDPERLRHEFARVSDLNRADRSTDFPDADVSEFFNSLFAPEDRDQSREAAMVFRAASTTAWRPRVDTIESVRTLIEHGSPVGIVSNTQRAYSEFEVRSLGIDGVAPVVFSSDVRACKPDPRALLRACELASVRPTECLYVGNDPSDDVKAAQAADMPVLLIVEPESQVPMSDVPTCTRGTVLEAIRDMGRAVRS